jgi:Tol biopolymer transport system component
MVLLMILIFFIIGCAREGEMPESVLLKRCEEGSWPPDCSFIEDLRGREECEKCIELLGEERFMSMRMKNVEIIEPADLTQLTFMDDASDPDWSPDGSQIIFESGENDIYLINADGTELTKIGSGNNPSWSPVDNRIIYRHDMPCCSLVLVDLDEGWENKVELASQIKEQGSWSPDGEKIAYTIPEGSESASIWVMNSDGSGKTRLTTDEDGFCMVPSFSYDGLKIVYLKGYTSYAVGGEDYSNPNEIWTMNVDGSNKQKIYAPDDSTQLPFQRAWNKDNKIIFMRTWYRGDYPQIWVMNSDGSNPEIVVAGAPNAFGDPVWNNAGTKVACSKNMPSLKGDIWIFSYEEPAER